MKPILSRLAADYGMLFVLGLLGAFFSWATLTEQRPVGVAGADWLAGELQTRFPAGARVFIATGESAEDAELAEQLDRRMTAGRGLVLGVTRGTPAAARAALEALGRAGTGLDAIACSQAAGAWTVFAAVRAQNPSLANAVLLVPRSQRWPNFLKADNLVNVANQIAVIAIIAIGMTLVIIAGGIDLSVGSLIALSAVISTLLIRNVAGGEHASAWGLVLCSAAGIAVCAGVGLVSGGVVTVFGVPPFIATLAMMLVASGLAFIAAEGQSIYQVPDSFVWLGRGATGGLPNSVWLMALLYAGAHVVMTRTVFGRQIYAVGGNALAARLSGVPVKRVVVATYVCSAGLAGLGGVIMASQLKSGAPTYGQMYELYVIAAVVVGGTSLAGGRGRVVSTLIGAFIIAVIRNGMNLTGVESYTQMVVLGIVILAAVLLDLIRHRGFRVWSND